MKRCFLFAVSCLLFTAATAQLVRNPVSVIYPSLHTYSSQFKDAFSFRANSASLAGIKNFSAGVFSERKFLMKELNQYSMAVALPTTSGNFGMKADYAGNALYNETTAGFAYGRSLGERLAIGLEFNYFSQQASGYGSASTLTFGGGAILQFAESVQAGVQVYNPVGMTLGKGSQEKLPSIYSMGIGYDVSAKFFIGAEAVKTEDQPLGINAGFQYLFADKLMARVSISSGSSTYYLGFGVQMTSIRVDAVASLHPYLGVTPGLLFLYSSAK